MKFQDRIREFREVKASDLIRNENNWRTHPDNQANALRTVMQEIGMASACLVRQVDGDQFELIDGHLRADVAGDEMIPCLILDVTEEEARVLLATFDPITDMAETDRDALEALLSTPDQISESMDNLLDDISTRYGINPADVEFPEFTEDIADSIEILTCQECGHEFPK